VDNAVSNNNFIQALPSTLFNDRLLVISSAQLMPNVEVRVAREMLSLLASYKAGTTVYPWADQSDGASNAGDNRQRFPCGAALPIPWGVALVTPTLPAWLTNGCGNNGWASIIYYAAARLSLDIGSTVCGTCTGNTLTVNGVAGTNLVLITPGAAAVSPRGNWPNPGTITGHFEDAENADNVNDSFVTPSSTAFNRDRIFKVP
jgi:hypothetical protein